MSCIRAAVRARGRSTDTWMVAVGSQWGRSGWENRLEEGVTPHKLVHHCDCILTVSGQSHGAAHGARCGRRAAEGRRHLLETTDIACGSQRLSTSTHTIGLVRIGERAVQVVCTAACRGHLESTQALPYLVGLAATRKGSRRSPPTDFIFEKGTCTQQQYSSGAAERSHALAASSSRHRCSHLQGLPSCSSRHTPAAGLHGNSDCRLQTAKRKGGAPLHELLHPCPWATTQTCHWG